jgi:transposase
MQDRKIVECLILKHSFNQISRSLKYSKKRIRKIAAKARAAGYLNGIDLPPFPESIFDYQHQANEIVSEMDRNLLSQIDWIKDRRSVGWSPITIHEELSIKVPRSTFYRFMQRHNLKTQIESERFRVRVVSEIIHAPGEALILDWGKLTDVTFKEKKKTLWFLVGVMGHSRYMMVRLVWDNKVTTTLAAITSMFCELKGVPQRIISDNPKCFATLASKYEPILNPAFERYCQHYGVLAELLPPRDPQKKGKVERMVPFVRRITQTHSEWNDLVKSQELVDKKVGLANERKHGSTRLKPIDVLENDERSLLKPLPPFDFIQEEYHTGDVRKDGHVQFRGKYYSLDAQYIKQEVFIIGTEELVQIFFKGKSIETHARIHNPFQSKSTKPQHQINPPEVMQQGAPYMAKGGELGPWVECMIKEIILRGRGFMDMRSIWGILSLDKKYSKKQIDDACKNSIESNQLGYRAVVRFIDYFPASEIAPSFESKFARNITEYPGQLKH